MDPRQLDYPGLGAHLRRSNIIVRIARRIFRRNA